ncbi:MAG: ParB/RepB/Spo0J family partition protein [Bacillota bacterium]
MMQVIFDTLQNISVSKISTNPSNPRKNFDPEALGELAQSIRGVGILQPLVLVPNGEGLRIVAGERRWRAAQLAGLESVPAIVKDLTPKQEAELMLTENLQRKDLDPIEEAQAYRVLLDEHGYTQEALAEKLGVSQPHIANRLRLLELPEQVRDDISRGMLSPSHGRALAGFVKNLPGVVIRKSAELIRDEGVPVAKVDRVVYKQVAEHGRPLIDYDVKFDLSGCEGCVHAKTGAKWYYPPGDKPNEKYCMKHSCYDKKQAEAEEERRQAMQKKVERMSRKGEKLIDLGKLGYGNFEYLTRYGVFFDQAECAGCENNKLGADKYDEKPFEICIKPSCFKKKKAAAEREKTKEAKEAFEAELEEIAGLVKLNPVMTLANLLPKRFLIYLAARMLTDVGAGWDQGTGQRKISDRKYLKDKFGWTEKVYSCTGDWWPKFLGLLETLTEKQLMEVILEWPAVAQGLRGAEEWFLKRSS